MHKKDGEMKRCKHCAWWTIQSDYPAGYGTCRSPKFRTETEQTEDDDAVVILEMDCYVYSALLFGPKFGCLHFKKGEEGEVICNR